MKHTKVVKSKRNEYRMVKGWIIASDAVKPSRAALLVLLREPSSYPHMFVPVTVSVPPKKKKRKSPPTISREAIEKLVKATSTRIPTNKKR